MSKPVKNWMMRDYQELLEGQDSALLISVRGISANDNNRLRKELAKKEISVTVIRNNLAKHAFSESPLSGLSPLLEGPSALAYGAESVVDVARELVKWAKDVENLELKGAVLDGVLFEGEAGVKRLSDFPTREEAQAKVVSVVLAPAQNLVGAATAPAKNIAGILKTIEERLEKGEAIAKVS
ncbi:MAG: 50S ribosomal protein L10 [bacterium]|nr:50S ribosomal protein L10 [bacterium]